MPLSHSPSSTARWALSPLTPEHVGQGSLTQENHPKQSLTRRQDGCTGWCRHSWAHGLTCPCSDPTDTFYPFSLCFSTLISSFLVFIPYPKHPIITQGAPFLYKHHWQYVAAAWHCMLPAGIPPPTPISFMLLSPPFILLPSFVVAYNHPERILNTRWVTQVGYISSMSEFNTLWFWRCCSISGVGT